MGHDGRRGGGGGAAVGGVASAPVTASAPVSTYTGVSTGRQRRKPSLYVAVPSHKDEARLAGEQWRKAQRAAKHAAKRAAQTPQRQPASPPPQPSRLARQQPPQQRPPHPLSTSKSSISIRADGSMLWRLPSCCTSGVDLPALAVAQWGLPHQVAAIFVLPDGSQHECTFKRHSNGHGGIQGWTAIADVMGLRPNDIVSLRAGARTQGKPLRVQFNVVERVEQQQLPQVQQCARGRQQASAVPAAGTSLAEQPPTAGRAAHSAGNADPLPSFDRTLATDPADEDSDGERQSPSQPAPAVVS